MGTWTGQYAYAHYMAAHSFNVDQVLSALRNEGKRITQAKRAVVSVLVSAEAHLTAEMITANVQHEVEDISPSTVYRILEELEEFGLVEHTHAGHLAASYHLTGRDHGHVTCENCQVTFEVPNELFDRFSRELRVATGFSLDRHHVALSGTCEECSNG
jgi:Fur family ferric uptake transcriptional regulator